MLIVVSGLPGTGKSTVAEGIAQALRATVLSVDPIESAMLRAGVAPSFGTGLAAYLVAETVADAALRVGLDVVIDAVSSVEAARDLWRALAARHETPLLVITCSIEDEETARARLVGRDRGLALPEPSADDLMRRSEEWRPWPEPHLTLDSMRPPDANLARAIAWLGTRGLEGSA